ncbi:MAG TPA: hypothetical protein VG165_17005 [Solirubrobacteraceae bacterium]|jgi:hypothetical protein|nr:hypothetical protein [Solirubrobacteraceae bacterium]
MLVLIIVIVIVAAVIAAAAIAIPRVGGPGLRGRSRRGRTRPGTAGRREGADRFGRRRAPSERVLLAEGEQIQRRVETRLTAQGIAPHRLSGPNPPTAAERIPPGALPDPALGPPLAGPGGSAAYVPPGPRLRRGQPPVAPVGPDADLAQAPVTAPPGAVGYVPPGQAGYVPPGAVGYVPPGQAGYGAPGAVGYGGAGAGMPATGLPDPSQPVLAEPVYAEPVYADGRGEPVYPDEVAEPVYPDERLVDDRRRRRAASRWSPRNLRN